jgi:small neutral amino acid transporter SnatA (MarC family)
MIDPSEIFTGLFVTLGPLKTLAPFAQRTRDVSLTAVRKIALWAFIVATTGSAAGGLIGRALLTKWHVSLAALMLTGGIIFFARFILRGLTIIILQVLGSVLAVLQVAMSVQFMLLGLRSLGVISG